MNKPVYKRFEIECNNRFGRDGWAVVFNLGILGLTVEVKATGKCFDVFADGNRGVCMLEAN